MTPLEALKIGRDALAEALDIHIYCAEAITAMESAIRAAEPKPVERYPSPHWRDHLSQGMRECMAFEYYEVRPCIEMGGEIFSYTNEIDFRNMVDDIPIGVAFKTYWTLYGRYDQGQGEMLAMAIGDFETKEIALEVVNAILAVPAAARNMIDFARGTRTNTYNAASLIDDMINQSSSMERL